MIGNIRERDLRGVDLNLLVTLLVLLRERSVSKAAECLHLGQPAVSGALARLRELFRDDLLVRAPGGMRPTPRGLELQSQLLPLVTEMQSVVLQRPLFDAATSERRFTLGVMDWVNAWLLPGLLARLAAQAPHVSVAVVATDRFRVADMLQREDIDLAIGPFSAGPAWQRTEALATVPYSCVARPDVIGKASKLTLKQFVALPHVMVTYRGAARGIVDEALAQRGLQRRIVCTVPGFASVPPVLKAMPAVATVPKVLADSWRNEHGLAVLEHPIALAANQVAMVTHQSRDNDPAVQWLGQVIRAASQPGR
ncbi:LysR family transcriptional regulator [Achromobacter spanius]|uniref:LysR family transcriptional regulator n=1 Tax=Achromobacter spanius TaxID=217203 RepID=UPI00320889AE